jgi:hypothetical protein
VPGAGAIGQISVDDEHVGVDEREPRDTQMLDATIDALVDRLGQTLASTNVAPKLEVKHALVEHFDGCIKRGAERCIVAVVLRRLVYKKQSNIRAAACNHARPLAAAG